MTRTRSTILALLSGLIIATAFACSNDAPSTVPPNETPTPRPVDSPTPEATATATSTPSPTPGPTATPTATATPVAPDVAFLAQLDLARRLNIGPNVISITSYSENSWPSSAYGCPLPGTLYLPVTVSGWSVTMTAAGNSYEYHTDDSGEVLVNCTENREIERQTINIVSLGNLRTTTEIEMRRRDGTGEFVLKNTVTDPDEIKAIVDVLDVPLLRQTAATCTEVFRLVFVTSTGNQTIGTICGGNSRLIRGDGAFWQGQDAQAPSEFSLLIGPYFSDEPLPVIPS